jgi:FAD/FMN-containing dehydrogenase/Fe-S oxidoreductase
MATTDQQREIMQDDLRGLVAGEVRCDGVSLQLYASDASIYEIRPRAVVRPRSLADVVATVRYAAEKQIPVHARGAGTGLAGESLGSGIVVDFSRFLRRILDADKEAIRVQPGVVHERLNTHLRPKGRLFGPNPTNGAVTTIGSMIAVDATGNRWPRYGSTRDHVRRLQVVLADGTLLDFGREPLDQGVSHDPNPRKRELITRLARLLDEQSELIRAHRPKCPVSRCGYNLSDVLEDGCLDVARLLAGSEGTLALITEAQLATQPLPKHRGVVLLLFDGMEKASRAVLEILPRSPSACDLMDRRHISLAREDEVRFDLLIPAESEAVLLVEQEAEDEASLEDWMRGLVDEVWHGQRLAFGARQTADPCEVDLFWQLANEVRSASYWLKGPARPVPVVEDMAVPPELLPDFLVRVQNVLKRRQVTASLTCHAGQGQLHVQPFLDLSDADDVERMRLLAEELYDEVFDVGGTISGEHACGLSRTPFVHRQVGGLYEVFREVKRIFDPANLFNPGKIVGNDPESLTRNLRPIVLPRPSAPGAGDADVPVLRNMVELQLNWHPAQVADDVAQCNRCGHCRTQSPARRMCPIARTSPSEEASPRAKVNLIHGVLSGALELGTLTSAEFKAVADLCIHCHACRLECPARVDVPEMMRESKGAYVSAHGLPLADYVMMHLDLLGVLGGLAGPVARWAIGNRQMRWLMEKTLGIAQGRKLPRVTWRTAVRRAARRRLTRPTRHGGPKVAYFLDTYANYFDPQLALAAISVLNHNGVWVYVPPRQKQSGMPSIAGGAIDRARRLAAWNVTILAEAVRQGYHVVTAEPSAALCLTQEYPQLIDDDDARLVADNSSLITSYLWKMHMAGTLRLDFQPIEAVLAYHTSCHARALQVGEPGKHLLGLIPGLLVHDIEAGCCGIAGTHGLGRANYRNSLRAGWGVISRLRDPAIQAGATECSACKIQMEQGTDKPTVHPIKLLALAYNVRSGFERLLTRRGEDLIVT